MPTRIMKYINNKTGCTGVCYNKSQNRYRATIRINGKVFYLGTFKNLEDAIKCRKEAEQKYLKKEK